MSGAAGAAPPPPKGACEIEICTEVCYIIGVGEVSAEICFKVCAKRPC